MLCGVLIIAIRLFQLQIYDHHKFATLSKKNFTRTQIISSPRGNITDINGTLLATNIPTNDVYWQGTGNRKLNDQQLNLIETIRYIFAEDDFTSFTFQRINYAEKFATKTVLAKNIPFSALTKISEQCGHSPNIVIENSYERHYPYKSYACHLLGYLGDVSIEQEGKMGLEKLLNPQLQGNQGIIEKKINSFGKILEQKEIQAVSQGQNITTNLDITLQKMAEENFPADMAGTFILLDPHDGAIKTLVSRPGFDPTIFLRPLTQATWQELQSKPQPFLNRAFQATYPPASIFKLVSISAALEEGIIDQDTQTLCRGFTTFGKRRYHCSRRYGHGWVDIKDSLAMSCNILFYNIAKKISINTLADYAHRFGLGAKTNVLLGDKDGIVPSREWKMMHKGESWWQGETLSAVIGQSFLLTTPIQLACMIGSIFQGYVCKPRLLKDEPIETKDLAIHEETRAFLQDCMKSVISTGTGRRISKLEDITIFAKTGTAQTSSWSKRKLGKKYKEHAWFAGYFYTNPDKPLVIMLIAEHVGGSRYTTTIAKNFLLKYKKAFPYLNEKEEA